MKDITIVVLLVVIAILTGVIDATLSLNDKRTEDFVLEDLYNPTGEWCFPSEYNQPLPVDCQFQITLLGKEID